jgi:hypothetical protein
MKAPTVLTKKFKLAPIVAGTAALLIVVPLAQTARTNRVASIKATWSINPEDGARSQRELNAVKFATSAAYRDGLFQGKQAAWLNTEAQVPMGRWSAPADKDAFAVGYRDGYAPGLAENNPPAPAK